MSLATFTLVTSPFSLVGMRRLRRALRASSRRRGPGWTTTFLGHHDPTDITGYFFPFTKVLPSHIVGAHFTRHSRGRGGGALHLSPRGQLALDFIAASVRRWYLNVFVAFAGVPQDSFLHELAPASDPSLVTQAVVMVAFRRDRHPRTPGRFTRQADRPTFRLRLRRDRQQRDSIVSAALTP